ncbi:MAG: bifunctional serine/threonine-protein kinase/formylglycine-generating enzyme family protein [Waddliaceae bacterium]
MEEERALGDYTIIKQLGHGALGSVYLAEHRFMKKQFALKILPEDLCSDRGFMQRFEEEVSQLSILDHPHIVKLHNISYDQGCYFLVTDCIVDEVGENINLAQYVQTREQPLSEDEVFQLLFQIAHALDYAHNIKGQGCGIAHRGIKLNNILVSKGEKGRHLYLADFGLSRLIGTGTLLTRTYKAVAESLGIGDEIAKGTIDSEKAAPLHLSFLQSYHFLAPEQKRLDTAVSVDAKADTYAFGVLAYYLLTREFPEGCFPMPAKWEGLLRSCLQSDPNNRPGQLLDVLEKLKDPSRGAVQHKTAEELLQLTGGGMEVELQAVQAAEQTQKVISSQKGGGGALKPIIHSTQIERPQHDPDPAAAFHVDQSVKHYIPERKEEKNIQPLLTDMVIIQGGHFYRGSRDGNRDEMPYHQITLESFAIDIHPVTNEQFVRFLDAMGGVKDSHHRDIIRLRDSRMRSSKGKFSIESGYLKHPVVGVTWYGAAGYAKWVGKRLPTEAEWEIAARGGIDNAYFPYGEDIEKSQANFFSSDTLAVMSYEHNGYGLYDMAGNVYEWCHDWYGYNYYETSRQEPVNPAGPLQGVYRVLRGGCWKSVKEDLRCSRRHRNNPGTVNSTYGFRCAADVQ